MRQALKSVALFGYALVRDVLAPFCRFSEVSILAYHSISDADVPTAVSARAFEAQLALLARRGYTFVSLDAVVAWREGKGTLPQKAVALTFDDGYVDFETTALPLLERFSAPATLFMVGDPSAARAQVQNDIPLLPADAETHARLAAHALVTLGYHSRSHADLAARTGDALRAECDAPFAAAYFAFPGGRYSQAALDMVEALGYRAAFSIKRRLVHPHSPRFLLPRTVVTKDMPLWELRARATKAADWYDAHARRTR